MLLAKLIMILLVLHHFNTWRLIPWGPGTLFSLICFLTCSYSELVVKWLALMFKSLSPRMVVTVTFSSVIFGGLPTGSLKQTYQFFTCSPLFHHFSIALLVDFLLVISFFNIQLSWCLLVLFDWSISVTLWLNFSPTIVVCISS